MVLYTCDICKKDFDNKTKYTNHINRKNPCIVGLTCPRCDVTFSRSDAFRRHINTAKKCTYNKKNVEEINKDIMKANNKKERKEKMWTCKCDKEFTTKYNYKRHKEKCVSLLPRKELEQRLIQAEERPETKIGGNHQTTNIGRDVNIVTDNSTNINNNINFNLTSAYRPNVDYITRADIKKGINKRTEVGMFRHFGGMVYFDKNHPENHNMFANSVNKIAYTFNGRQWKESKMNDKYLTSTLQMIMFAIERKLREGDENAHTKEYIKLIGIRAYENLERIVIDYRDDIKKMMIEFSERGMAVKEKWEKDQNQKLLELAKNKDDSKEDEMYSSDEEFVNTHDNVRDYWNESSSEESLENIELINPVETITIEELD